MARRFRSRYSSFVRGYNPPSIASHYAGRPSLTMEEASPASTPTTSPLITPETLVIRCDVRVAHFDVLPVLDGGIPFDTKSLYTAEGLALLHKSRVRSVSLVYAGVCLTPTPEAKLLPCPTAASLLPFALGEVIYTHAFHMPDSSVLAVDSMGFVGSEDASSLALYPLGGCVESPSRPLESKPLYFFLEGATGLGGGGGSALSVRFMFDEDIRALSVENPALRLVFPEGVSLGDIPNPRAALLSGACRFSLTAPVDSVAYHSVHVTMVSVTQLDLVLVRAAERV